MFQEEESLQEILQRRGVNCQVISATPAEKTTQALLPPWAKVALTFAGVLGGTIAVGTLSQGASAMASDKLFGTRYRDPGLVCHTHYQATYAVPN